MEDRIITPENLVKIGFIPYKEGKRTCYRRGKLNYWFEDGLVRCDWPSEHNTKHLIAEINEAIKKGL